jgi:radical SAM protein with 4Fe4S-binding SPASM domain
VLLQWHVTERCNLRCQHCYQDSTPCPELDFESLVVILEQFKALVSGFRTKRPIPAHITLTGGEPFIRTDFLQLVELIAGQPDLLTFAILTNGTLVDHKVATWLARMKPAYVQVSLDGRQVTHDQIRGVGNFEQTLEAIRNLTGKQIHTHISFTAQRHNYHEFLEVARVGRKLKAQLVWSDRVIPAGRNREELETQALSPDETREWLDILGKAEKETLAAQADGTRVGLNRALQFWVGNNHPYRCSAGRSLICLLPNGDLVPCRRMPIVVGNVHKQSLDELYQCEFFEKLQNPNQEIEGCEECLCKHLCSGGLRCLSYALTGSPFTADPGCWHRQINKSH